MPKKIALKIKLDAEKDFVSGLTLAEICSKYSLGRRTVLMWYMRLNWKEKRAEFAQRVREARIVKMIDKIVENSESLLDSSRLANRIVLEIAAKKYARRDSCGENELLDIADRLAQVAQRSARIQNDVQPTAREDLMQRAIDDVEELKGMLDDEEIEDVEE
jgi:hypothetical protein